MNWPLEKIKENADTYSNLTDGVPMFDPDPSSGDKLVQKFKNKIAEIAKHVDVKPKNDSTKFENFDSPIIKTKDDQENELTPTTQKDTTADTHKYSSPILANLEIESKNKAD